MSNIATSWAYRCHVGNAPAKAVLVYLADRASDDGTAAFPKIDTIVRVTEYSESSVRKSLRLLQRRGFIRKGDQRYARIGRNGRERLPQYCQVVWDLAVETDPATLAWIEETHAGEYDPGTMGAEDPAASEIPRNDETKGLAGGGDGADGPVSSPAPRTVLETTPEPHHVQGQPCTTDSAGTAPDTVLPYKEETIQDNPPSQPFPSAPSGHLPADGEISRDDDGDVPDDGELAGAAGRVLASLAEQRSKLGLTTPEPTAADRRAVTGLYRRLVGRGCQWPTVAMVEAIGWAMRGDWWPKRIRTGRSLARHWDELTDDMTIATAGVGDAGGRDVSAGHTAVHVHDAGCAHVRAILDSEAARAIEPQQSRRSLCADRVAESLNRHPDDPHADYFATVDLLDALRDRRDADRRALDEREARRKAEREAMMDKIRRLRESNGGSMFAGAAVGRRA